MKTNLFASKNSLETFLNPRLIYFKKGNSEQPDEKKDYNQLFSEAMDTSGYTEKGWFNPEKSEKEARESMRQLKAEIEKNQESEKESPEYQEKKKAREEIQKRVEAGEIKEPIPKGFPKDYDKSKDKHELGFDAYNQVELFPRYANAELDGKIVMDEFLGLWDRGVFRPSLDADGRPILARDKEGKLIRITHGLAAKMRQRNWEGRPLRIWEEKKKGGVKLWKKKELEFYSNEEAEAYKRGPYVPVKYKMYWALGTDNGEVVRNKEGKTIGAFDQGRTFRDLTPQEVENYGIQAQPERKRGNYNLDVAPRQVREISPEEAAKRAARRERIEANKKVRQERIEAYGPEAREYNMPAREHFIRPEKQYTQEEVDEMRKNFFENEEAIENGMDVIFNQEQSEMFAKFRVEHASFRREDAKQWAIDLAELAFDLVGEPRDSEKYETIFKYWVKNVRKNVLKGPRGYKHLLEKNIDFNNPDPDAIYLLYLAVNSRASGNLDPEIFGYGTNHDIQYPEAMEEAMQKERSGLGEKVITKNYGVEAVINGYVNILPRQENLQLMAEDVMVRPNSSTQTSLKTTLEALEMTQTVQQREAEYIAATPEERVELLEKYKQQNESFQEVHEMMAKYAREVMEDNLSPEEKKGLQSQILEHLNRVRQDGKVLGEDGKYITLAPLTDSYWEDGIDVLYLQTMSNKDLEELYKNTAEADVDSALEDYYAAHPEAREEDAEGNYSSDYRAEIKKEMKIRKYTFEINEDYDEQIAWVKAVIKPEDLAKDYYHDEELLYAHRSLRAALKSNNFDEARFNKEWMEKMKTAIEEELDNRGMQPLEELAGPGYAPGYQYEVTREQYEDYEKSKRNTDKLVDYGIQPGDYGVIEGGGGVAQPDSNNESLEEESETTLEDDKEQAIFTEKIGDDSYRQEKYREAASSYAEALEFSPNNPELYSKLGDCLHKLGRYEQAAQFHLRAIQLAPTVWHYYNGRGYDLMILGKNQEALDTFKMAETLITGNEDESQYSGVLRSTIEELEEKLERENSSDSGSTPMVPIK